MKIGHNLFSRIKKMFLGGPHLATYIFFLFVNELHVGLVTLIDLTWL